MAYHHTLLFLLLITIMLGSTYGWQFAGRRATLLFVSYSGRPSPMTTTRHSIGSQNNNGCRLAITSGTTAAGRTTNDPLRQYSLSSSALAATSSSDPAAAVAAQDDDTPINQRTTLLHEQLERLGIDPTQLEQASNRQYRDPIAGYDGRFGRSAIRTYRSFVDNQEQSSASQKLQAHAFRAAQQIDFLMKRHASHETAWIRHHDDPATDGNDTNNSTVSSATRFPLILILDNLRSALNVGSLFRTADAAGCAQVWTVGITPHPNGNGAEKLRKSALGAETVVPHQHFATLQQAMEMIHQQNSQHHQHATAKTPDASTSDHPPSPQESESTNNPLSLPCEYQIVGMETTAKSKDYTQIKYDPTKGIALVLGNEVTGVTASALPQMDYIVEIPTFGVKNSLNVASCAPIVLYEIIRQWKD